MPYVWNTPGIWGIDFLQPSGMGELFGGLPIVDGVVLTDSFAGSMASGLIDVPLIMGGMAQECEDGPGNKIRGAARCAVATAHTHTHTPVEFTAYGMLCKGRWLIQVCRVCCIPQSQRECVGCVRRAIAGAVAR